MGTLGKSQRHARRKFFCDRMKMHLRSVATRAARLQILSLRPRTDVTYSNNYFHDTWHVLSDVCGAKLFARLLWGMSFQRRPGTAFLLFGEHIAATPFEADSSSPILIFKSGAFPDDSATLRSLQRQMNRWGPSNKTIRWHTFGLADAVQLDTKVRAREWSVDDSRDDGLYHSQQTHLWRSERMFRRSGLLCYTAPPSIMRLRARSVYRLNPASFGMDYCYLADSNDMHHAQGEVQIFADYHERCVAAREARAQISPSDYGDRQAWYAAVANRRAQILSRRRAT